MIEIGQRSDAMRLLRDGWTDEAVERLTSMSLTDLVELRAEAATRAPARSLDGQLTHPNDGLDARCNRLRRP